ncbi:hypothetical protein ABZP36_005334 [Zizania latifolia]
MEWNGMAMSGVAEERGQVHDGTGATAHRLLAADHDVGTAGEPRQHQLRRLRQRAEPRPQPPPPGQPPPAPAEAPGRRHRLRQLLRRAPRRHEEPGGGAYNFEIFSTCGSPEVTTACAQPAKYVNWDGVHMTEAMYKVVAGMFFQDARYCQPPFSAVLASRKKKGQQAK